MSTSLGPKSAASTSGSWTSGSNAYANGGGNASCSTNGVAQTYGAYDFSALPSTGTLTVAGIAVRLDAWYPLLIGDPADVATLTVDLSWDNGSTWTSTKVTSQLADSESTFTLGGSTDTWGRTWTRSELQSGTLLVRVKTSGSFIGGGDTWHLDYMPVTVYYTNRLETDGSAAGTSTATAASAVITGADGSAGGVGGTGGLDASIIGVAGSAAGAGDASGVGVATMAISVFDGCVLTDGGTVLGGGSGESAIIGDNTDEIAGGGPTFEAAGEQYVRRETMAIQIIASGSTSARVFQVGDAISSQDNSGPGLYQPGILEWGDMVLEGLFGLESETTGATLRVRNTTFADIATGNLVDFASDMQQMNIIGATIRLQVFFEDGGVWYNKLIFVGLVEDVECLEDYIEIRAFQIGDEDVMVPARVIDEGLFTWGDAEGQRPQGFMGSAIPIFFGRFGPTALKEYPSGSVFEWDHLTEEHDGSVIPSGNYRRFVLGIYYSILHGIRIPLLPIPLGTDRNRGISTQASSLWDKMTQSIFVFGDRGSAPFVGMSLSNTGIYRFQAEVGDTLVAPPENIQHILACTWDGQRKVGQLFARDISNDLAASPTRERSSCGDADMIRASGISAVGSAKDVQAFFVNRSAPDWGTTETPKWSGFLQTVAIPFAALSQIRQTTGGVAYGTTASVVNPLYAIDPDPDTYAEVPSGQVLSLQGPEGLASLGDILMVRLGVLLHRSSSVGATVRARWSWQHDMVLTASWGATQAGNGITADGGTPSYGVIKTRYGPLVQDPGATASPPPSVAGWADWWSFLHYSQEVGAPTSIIPFPMDVRIVGNSGTVRVVHAWLEVMYRSSAQQVKNPIEKKGFIVRNPPGSRRPYSSVLGTVRQAELEQTSAAVSSVLLAGSGPRDSGSRYTGSASSVIIENPADIFGFLIDKYQGASAFGARAQGTEFGSFVRARDRLNAVVPGSGTYSGWKFTSAITDRQTMRELAVRYGFQCGTLFQQQLNDVSGALIWRAFVDEPDPATTAPERLYRTDGYYFTWNRLFPSSFRARLTDRSSICADFLLRYGADPEGQFCYEKFIRSTSNNLATAGSTYQAACADTINRYRVTRQRVIEAPDIWNHATAEARIKYECDLLRARRVLVEFDAFGSCVDLKPGHVIRFADEIGNRVAYPGLRSGSTWSGHEFNVMNVRIAKDAGKPIGVHVIAVECFERAA